MAEILSAKVTGVSCPSTEACVATVELIYQLNDGRTKYKWPVTTSVEDRWIRVDADWMHVQDY